MNQNKSKFSKAVYAVAIILVAGVLIACYSNMEDAKKVNQKVAIRQIELQKDSTQQTKDLKSIKNENEKRYRELNSELTKVNISVTRVQTSQEHISKNIDKIGELLHKALYNRNKLN